MSWDKRYRLAEVLINTRAVNMYGAQIEGNVLFSYVAMPEIAKQWLEQYLGVEFKRSFQSLEELESERTKLKKALKTKYELYKVW